MPPKRKATPAKTGAGGKKAKNSNTIKDTITTLKSADAGQPRKHTPDPKFMEVHGNSSIVYEDYDCMLNQTNIDRNNNKFYVIQVMKSGDDYYTWTRWGRVGETGQSDFNCTSGPQEAIQLFESKFSSKTGNKWKNRDSFIAKPGKYTLIEMAGGDEDEVDSGSVPAIKMTAVVSTEKTDKCTLDVPTQALIRLIFDRDMFQNAMQSFDIDVKKMPLGKLSTSQIAKGFECLDELETAIKKKDPAKVNNLSSRFYTVIPHSFGRAVPPPINTQDALRKKLDMLMVLADIEVAQSLEKRAEKVPKSSKLAPHVLDTQYNSLRCKLELLDKTSDEYKTLDRYVYKTRGNFRTPLIKQNIINIWKMDRRLEEARYKEHNSIKNRKLLWHGTNIAVVVAILKEGLRIMPHSGGALGRGIYFASEQSKSAGYVSPAYKKGIMFLNEVALGNQKHVKQCDCSITKAPKGFESVVGTGRYEPDPKQDTFLTLDGRKVTVPQGKPVSQRNYHDSGFGQSEYLIYKESQVRMRYVVLFDWGW